MTDVFAARETIEIRGNGFTVRPARKEDLAQARQVIMRVTEEDIKFPYTPRFHFDVDQAEIVYLENPRHALFVAIDDASGDVIGTSAVRTGGPLTPPFPAWFTDRYPWDTTAQLYRVYIAREHRRRGVATAVVEAARRFAENEGGYDCIYLHTNASVEGAEPFWRSVARLTYDGRGDNGPSKSVHFELPLHKPLPLFSETSAPAPIDWHEWLRRWDAQQASSISFREQRFTAMLDAVEAVLGEEFTIIDLMCGPGEISRRVLKRFPKARVIAIDLDPVLMTMGRETIGEYGDRVQWLEADLQDSSWTELLQGQKVDGVLSTTAIHWLSAGSIVALYQNLADVIRPGGLFLNGDHMYYLENQPVLRKAAMDLRDKHVQHSAAIGVENWYDWWLALREEPGLQELLQERDRRFNWRGADRERSIGAERDDNTAPVLPTQYELHRAGLLNAGFSEVDVLWQSFGNRLLAAVR